MNYNLLLTLLIISIQISYGSTYSQIYDEISSESIYDESFSGSDVIYEEISYGNTYDEQVQILQKLKELFITDFNSFLDFAIDTVKLDYLEMEIPIHFLKHFSLHTPTNGDAPKISIERFYNVRPGRKTYSVFTLNKGTHSVITTKRKLTKNSFGYMADDDPYFRFTKTSNEKIQNFFSEQQINLSRWESIKFKMFFQKNGNHQIYIFDKIYPFSCFTMLFSFLTHNSYLLSELHAQGYYSSTNQNIVYHKSQMIIWDDFTHLLDVKHLLDVWEKNGLVFNFQSSKNLFHFPPFLKKQKEFYYLNKHFPEIDMGDPNPYLYFDFWQNINYLNSEDSPFFEENIFKKMKKQILLFF